MVERVAERLGVSQHSIYKWLKAVQLLCNNADEHELLEAKKEILCLKRAVGAFRDVTVTIINTKLDDNLLFNNVGTSSIVGALLPVISGRTAVSACRTKSKVANTIANINSVVVGIETEQIRKVKPKGNKVARRKRDCK